MIFQLLLLIIGLLTALYFKTWKKMTHWSSMGVPEDPGSFPLGSQPNKDMIMQKISFADYFDKSYPRFKKDKLWGLYGVMGKPQLVVNYMELMKDVLIKDFEYFPDQRDFFLGSNKYLADMLFCVSGERWKALRTLATPVFTSGKLKAFVPLFDSIGDDFVKHLEKIADAKEEMECKNLFNLFTIDASASFGFGIDAKAISDPNSAFKDQVDKLLYRGKYANTGGMLHQFYTALGFLWTDMARLIRAEVFHPQAVDFFANIIKNQCAERMRTGNKRSDFIGSMIQGLRQAEKDGRDGAKLFKDEEDFETAMVANVFVLFLGGFDTSSTSASATAWFLAKNPDVQEAAYQEIKDAIDANEGSQHLEYETLNSLPYLDGVLNESLRLYSLGHLERTCKKEYTFNGTNITVKPGTIVQIPSTTWMKDADIFEDPLKFDPTRWGIDGEARKNPYLQFAFGHGPRNCIGRRFALIQNKIAFIRLLANFKLVTCDRTSKKLVADPASPILDPVGGVWLKCVRR